MWLSNFSKVKTIFATKDFIILKCWLYTCILTEYASESERRSLMQEIDMMKDIGYHRHVVCMLACCTIGSTIALVMEFIPCGNLLTFLKKHRDPETQVIKIKIKYY